MPLKNINLAFVDVNKKDVLRDVSFDLKKGEDVIIYSSDSEVVKTFKKILIFKNKKYSGLIQLGNNFLTKTRKDFWISSKALSIFADKNKTHYYKKTLYEVLTYSLETNEYMFNLNKDFQSDWKEISEENVYQIQEVETDINTKMFEKQIDVYKEFISNENFIALENINRRKNIESKIKPDLVFDYLRDRKNMLFQSMVSLTEYEVQKYENYQKFQELHRNKKGLVVELKDDWKKAKEEYESIYNHKNKQKNHEDIFKVESKKIEIARKKLETGILNKTLIKLLKSKLKDNKINAKKEKIYLQTKEEKNKAKIWGIISKESFNFFSKNIKSLSFLNDEDIVNFYHSIREVENEMYGELYFYLISRKNSKTSVIKKDLKSKYLLKLIPLQKKDELKKKILENELKDLVSKLEKEQNKEYQLEDEEIDLITKTQIINEYYEKKAEYFWQKEKKANDLKNTIQVQLENEYQKERELIKLIIRMDKTDNKIYEWIRTQKDQKINLEVMEKLDEIKTFKKQLNFIYQPSSLLSTSKHFEDNEKIQELLIKNVLFQFMKNNQLNPQLLWKAYGELTLEEKIRIDISKISLYKPEIAILNIDKTLFGPEFINEILNKKDPKTSLIVFSKKYIKSNIKNSIFIEKQRIIEKSWNNENNVFISKFAKEFQLQNDFNVSLLSKISNMQYKEMYEGRKNINYNNTTTIYDSTTSKGLKEIRESYNTNEILENTLDISDTLIIDIEPNKKGKKNGKKI